VLRGENSDILEKATATRMTKKAKQARLVTVRGIGHAPSLDEPEALAAIAAFLADIK
jgi:pimeloyl-ACP methyl ester carboxylesterase